MKTYKQLYAYENNEFVLHEIEFLGYVVTNDAIKLDISEFKAIQKWINLLSKNGLGYLLA